MFGRKKEKKKVVKFYYKDRVEVITGFHKGETGVLINRTREQTGPQYYCMNRYQIKLDDGEVVIWADECEIRKIT